MTERDETRAAKALQGIQFPAHRDTLVEYASERGANPKTVQAIRTLPDGPYNSIDDVIEAMPQEPEGDQPGGTTREDVRQSPTHAVGNGNE